MKNLEIMCCCFFFFKFDVFTFPTCSMNLKLSPPWSPLTLMKISFCGMAPTADSLPHTDLTTRRQNLANLHCRHNQLEIFPLCLGFPSACWLFWCPPQSALSWITLSMCALGTLTPMDLRNLLCFLYLFQLKPSLVRNAELCSLEIAGLSMPAAWSSFSFVGLDDRKGSLRKLQWHGYVSRSSGLAKTILQGTVKGRRRQGRRRKRWEDNIGEWTDLEFSKSQGSVENRGKWRKLVVKSSPTTLAVKG